MVHFFKQSTNLKNKPGSGGTNLYSQQRQGDLCEFKASLLYIAGSKATQRKTKTMMMMMMMMLLFSVGHSGTYLQFPYMEG